ncbi:hypothetical protein CD117_08315 [Mammaliicoccus sciuri]|uniref:Transcriptional regulator SarA/SarZ/Rot-like helix-turn-helix domain-containing protein n=1 Tax=Mammaliicoccus sciuri TaxID=1296 RepID=A0AAJ4VHT6_MAMSC|nr:hypothetical protein [Mammaliicoccus sciuri]RTX72558.1 hypothetical protein CD117_08315 [Mammaliicoccus sciuri]
MEVILTYESKRDIILQKIFESTNLKRTDIIILYLLKTNVDSKITLKKIREILFYIPPAEISMSLTKLHKKNYLAKTRASYDERTLIIDNIDFEKISYSIDICDDIIKSQLSIN